MHTSGPLVRFQIFLTTSYASNFISTFNVIKFQTKQHLIHFTVVQDVSKIVVPEDGPEASAVNYF
jgi:hypothetical protein